jgi:ubiquinone/menaquinone biosynthesis C-methylase UbiE
MDFQPSRASADYALGYTSAEHERLIRQAVRIAPITERLFREAGIGPGQRVLDLGSGVGDVAMLLARMVSPSGEVVGVERDGNSVARARARVSATGLRNVNFIQTEASEFSSDKPFDAAVGRFILMFLPDPVAVLRSLSMLVRPGGVLAFQEPSWVPLLALGARLPLWSKVLSSIHETFLRSGVNPEMGPELCRIFQEIGLPAPTMHMEIALGRDVVFISLLSDLLCSVQELARQHNVSLEGLGNFDTLSNRIREEVAASDTVVSFVPMVGAWSQKPGSQSSG